MAFPSPDHPFWKDGFTCMQDAALGQRVTDMIEEKIPLQSVDGFAFLNKNILHNVVSKKVDAWARSKLNLNKDIMTDLTVCLRCESFALGVYRTIGLIPGAYSLRRSDPKLPAKSVAVHLLPKNSKIAIWKSSHSVEVPYVGKFGMWRSEDADLARSGAQRIEKEFQNGG